MKLIIAVLILAVIVGLFIAVRRSLAKRRMHSRAKTARFAARSAQSVSARDVLKASDPGTERVQDSSGDRFDRDSLAAPDDEDDGKYWRRYYR